jgi:hypothetical protein
MIGGAGVVRRKKNFSHCSSSTKTSPQLQRVMNTPPRMNGAAAQQQHMSPPASPGNPEFVQFLQGLCNQDNTIRQTAEAHYNQLKSTNPSLLVTNLLAQLRSSSDPAIQEFCAVLLRGLVGRRAPVYESLDPTIQQQLRLTLLQIAIETANNRTLSKKVAVSR